MSIDFALERLYNSYINLLKIIIFKIKLICTKYRKEVKNMKKTMNTVQAGREMQERSFKRMMAYQKKAEQAVNKKRMNQHMIRRG